jgi:hypothetical protein
MLLGTYNLETELQIAEASTIMVIGNMKISITSLFLVLCSLSIPTHLQAQSTTPNYDFKWISGQGYSLKGWYLDNIHKTLRLCSGMGHQQCVEKYSWTDSSRYIIELRGARTTPGAANYCPAQGNRTMPEDIYVFLVDRDDGNITLCQFQCAKSGENLDFATAKMSCNNFTSP